MGKSAKKSPIVPPTPKITSRKHARKVTSAYHKITAQMKAAGSASELAACASELAVCSDDFRARLLPCEAERCARTLGEIPLRLVPRTRGRWHRKTALFLPGN